MTFHKQERVAGENAISGNVLFAGSLGTQVVKVFDLVAARAGLRDREARRHLRHRLHHGMTVDAMSDLELSYTPPLGSPWDAVQVATQAWSRDANALQPR